MWKYLVRFILRKRLGIIIVVAAITIFMAYKAKDVKLSYHITQMLPKSDSTWIKYQQFKNKFGEDGSVFFIGIQDKKIYQLNEFNDWYDLTNKIKKLDGIQEVVSIAKAYHIIKNETIKKFDLKSVIQQKPRSQEELDSLKKIIFSLPIYNGILFNKEKNSTLMAITLNKNKLNDKSRITLLKNIEDKVNKFGKKYNIKIHYSGLPYIRTVISNKVKNELVFFVLLAIIVSSIVLFIFFRSFESVLLPIIIVTLSVIWALGTLVLFDYKITILTGIIPPLLIIIGVENFIFLQNKYHQEYKAHGNKVKALSRIIQRIGNAIFLTNLTTAAGFATFIITGNKALVEFGITASINIMIMFALSMLLIPILFSYLKPPKRKQIKYLDNKTTAKIIDKIEFAVLNRRKIIYIVVISLAVLGVFGITKLKTTGRMIEDISSKNKLYTDLVFFQKQVNGVLPFEISIDTKKNKGVLQLSTLRKINKLQKILETYPEFSKPLSIVEYAKSAKQAFYNGDESMYSLPNNQEKNFILSYIPKFKKNKKNILRPFIDTNFRTTRISVQMANIGTKDIQRIKDELRPKIDSIFNPSKYDVTMTGTSVVFLKGTAYMVKNLFQSLLLAILVISILMALLFTSFKMIIISLIPNIFPQLLTAALMGYIGISIKPSTILIFSVALGISVDNAIHYLSRYRIELKYSNWNIKQSVILSLRKTGFSMMYSSIVLFFGFAMFMLSSFEGTRAMGFLISFTLLTALISNLFLLPSLLLSLDKIITTKAFKEPLLEIFDEEEDIELEKLEIEKNENNNDIDK